jgi:hypothetical protein
MPDTAITIESNANVHVEDGEKPPWQFPCNLPHQVLITLLAILLHHPDNFAREVGLRCSSHKLYTMICKAEKDVTQAVTVIIGICKSPNVLHHLARYFSAFSTVMAMEMM